MLQNSMLKQLINRLPDGPKKDQLVNKLSRLESHKTTSNRKGATGLQDNFKFDPKGHIKIEAIDKDGNVTGVLQDKDNLVVNGAEEIALRALAGDPSRTLYRNRTIKPDATGNINNVKVYISEDKLNGVALHDAKGILHDPNVFWTAVNQNNENDFITDFAYYPNTVYIKEETSTEPSKKAFSISMTPSADRVPLVAETYSTSTNMFIGLGDGKQKNVLLDDPRFVITGDNGATKTAEEIKTTVQDTVVKFSAKITRFAVTLEKSNTGGQVKISVNGIEKRTVDTFDSSLEEPQPFVYELTGLDDGAESRVEFKLVGKDEAVTTPVMKITRFECDALDKSMNVLFAEFKNFETKFLTPTPYNTASTAPYKIELPHRDVLLDTLTVSYEGKVFDIVEDVSELAEGKVVVDKLRGTLEFDRALTNVQVSYEISGKVFDEELVATMTVGTANTETIVTNTPITNAAPSETPDGTIVTFTFPHQDLVANTVKVYVDSVEVAETDIDNIDLVAGTVTFATAPDVSNVITADYEYPVTSTATHQTLKYALAHPAKPEGIYLEGEDGVAYEFVENASDVFKGKFAINPSNPKELIVGKNKADGVALAQVVCVYASDEVKGIETNYRRAVIEKPKTGNDYPWFNLDKGTIQFVAEFPEDAIKHNVMIREMGLFDGPRVDDAITGFYNRPVKAFSLVRTGETLKDVNTGVRITWTIKLTDENNNAFKGGNNK